MTRWLRALTAAVALATLLVGLPVVLIALAGWPLPSAVPDWDNVGRILRQGNIPSAAVVKTLAIVLWLLWIAIVWSFAWELRTSVRWVSRGERPARAAAPAVPAAVSGWVGRLVAAVLAIGVVATPTSSGTAARLPVATVVAEPLSEPVAVSAAPAAFSPQQPTAPVARQWLSGPGDTVWDIAEAALGDGLRVDEIVALNPELRPARPVPAGRSIALPADATVPANRRPVTSAPPEPADPATAAAELLGASSVVVERGDTLWAFATARLHAAGVDTTPAAVARYVTDIAAANPDVIDDPNLIFEGQRLVLPAVTTAHGQPVTAAPPPEPIPAPDAGDTGAAGDAAPVAPSPADPSAAADDATAVPSGSRLLAETTFVVQRGDTLWAKAVERLHAAGADHHDAAAVAAYLRQIVAANPGAIADPNLIYEGQELVLPAVTVPAAEDEPPGPEAPTGDGTTSYTVGAGESLTEIVLAHYGRNDADLVWAVSDRNGLDDPGAVEPGQVLVLPPLAELSLPAISGTPPFEVTAPEPPAVAPAVPDPAAAAAPTNENAPADGQPAVPVPSSVAPSATSVPTSIPPPVAAPAATPTAATATSTPTTVTAAGAPASAEAASDGDGIEDVSLFDRAQRTVWWSVPMGLLLASGIVVMMRRLRNRRLQALEPGEQLQSPPAVAAGTELAATMAASPVRLATLQALLRSVTPHARELDDPPAVRAVELSDDRVEILFAEPAPFPPAGWTSNDGGRSWVHRLDDGAEPTEAAVRQLVTPALVTFGRRAGGGEVLLDVETAGSMALAGDRAACLGLARSVALELATYPLGVPMDVCLVGVDIDGLEHCDRAWTNTTMTRAVRVAREMLERTAATGSPSLVAARAATDDDEGLLDPQVFVVDGEALSDADGALLDELVALCQPQAGAAVVVIGGHRAARELVTVTADGTADWSGARLRAPVLTREAVAQMAVTFEHAATAPVEPLSASPVVAEILAAADDDVSADLSDEDDEATYAAPVPDVVVRVMGEVTVEGRDVGVASDVELLTLLVCLRDRSPNIDTLTTMLGRDKIRPIQNRVSKLRARLGVGRDGEDLLPAARARPGGQGRYQVSPLVMSDVELLEHRYQSSLSLASQDALAVLRDGLALMSGPAFRARKGYDWAVPEGVQARVASIVNAYAARLMELAFESDQLELVVEAARCAGRVIDDPVAEIPMRRLQREYAEASGHPELQQAVVEALRRLSEYAEDTDRLVPDDL